MAWGGTLINMTAAGINLTLDAGEAEGSYVATALSIGADPQWIFVNCHFDWYQDAAGGPGGVTGMSIFWRISEDGAVWGDYEPYHPSEVYAKEFQFKIEAWAVPGIGYLPILTQLNPMAYYARGGCRQPNVLDSTIVDPPGAPSVGDRYLINGVGINGWAGYDGYIAECTDDYAATIAWVYTLYVEGQKVFDENAAVDFVYRTAWRSEVGSTTNAGIVELATDGEEAADKVVQGNDGRVVYGEHGVKSGDSVVTGAAVVQTVLTNTFTAGDLDDAKDHLLVSIAFYTGNGASGGGRIVAIQWNAVTVWTSGVLVIDTKYQFQVEIWKSPLANTISWACEPSLDGNTPQEIVGHAANWMEQNEAISVIAQGMFDVTMSKCSAQVTYWHCP